MTILLYFISLCITYLDSSILTAVMSLTSKGHLPLFSIFEPLRFSGCPPNGLAWWWMSGARHPCLNSYESLFKIEIKWPTRKNGITMNLLHSTMRPSSNHTSFRGFLKKERPASLSGLLIHMSSSHGQLTQ